MFIGSRKGIIKDFGLTWGVHGKMLLVLPFRGGTVVSWLVRVALDQLIRVQALAGDTVLCS